MMKDPVIRPSIMGFHDGVVSLTVMALSLLTSGASPASIMTPGLAAAFAGAVSMSLGEYSSVSGAVDHDIDHESPTRAAISSFASFFLGASIPLLLIANNASSMELVIGTISAIGVTAFVSGYNITRTLMISGIAFAVSTVFGRIL